MVNHPKKKLAHLFNSIEYSGAERMIFSLKEFYNDRYETYAISTGGTKGAFYPSFSEFFQTFHLPIAEKRNGRYILDFFKMVAFYKREKIDILHIHPSRRFFFNVMSAKLGGVKKIVRQVHNNFYFTDLVRVKEGLGRKLAIGIGVSIIAISKSVRETEKERFHIDAPIINNFFDEDKIFPASGNDEMVQLKHLLGIPVDSFCIISVGSCIERKQHDHILRAVAKLKENIPQIFYIHLGDGERCELEKLLAIELHIEDRVLFAGNQANVRDYYVCADIYVMPSQLEGLGNSSIEAMGAGIPAVLYNVPGSRELGQGDAPGILVEPNANAMAASVLALQKDKVKRNELASASYAFAIRYHSKKLAMRSWEAAYLI